MPYIDTRGIYPTYRNGMVAVQLPHWTPRNISVAEALVIMARLDLTYGAHFYLQGERNT